MEINREFEDKIIKDLEEIGNTRFSDEQLEILRHHGGMSILACAGSGKTSSLINLIAKRIKTGEIKYPSKLMCTTYSRGGAQELEERLNKLLPRIGIHEKITVKTLHALYLQILKRFGMVSDLITNADRGRFIRESIKEAGLTLDQDEIQTVDSLLSYQVNNLLSDADLINTYVYTLDNVSLAEYTQIRTGYNNRKKNAGLSDFDDLQLIMFVKLVRDKNQSMLDYIKSNWSDFYVDEAQDISRIQFEILRMMITDSSRLVFIGDDDQCLVGDTVVKTLRGNIAISEVREGDKVLAGVGSGRGTFQVVEKVFEKEVDEEIIVVRTKNGRELKGTQGHIGFVKVEKEYASIKEGECNIVHGMLQGDRMDHRGIRKSELRVYTSKEISEDVVKKYMNTPWEEVSLGGIKYETTRYLAGDLKFQEDIIRNIERECKDRSIKITVSSNIRFNGGVFAPISLVEMEKGMVVPLMVGGKVIEDEVWSVERVKYEGKVYDLSIPSVRNFNANDFLIHNCIYQWRGADPSIILNIDAYYEVGKFKLSTNYRCKGNIVRPAAQGIKNNANRYDKDMVPYEEGGSIRVVNTGGGDLFNQSKYAFAYILDLVNNKGVRPCDIAVLSRNNIHLSILNNMLFREGIFSEINADMKFTGTYMYIDIKNVIMLSENSCDPHLTRKILWKMCRFMGVRGARYIGDFQDSTGMSLGDAIGYILWRQGKIKVENPRYMRISSAVRVRVEAFGRGLKSDTMTDLELIYAFLESKEREKSLIGLISMYLEGTAFMYSSKDKKQSIEGMVYYVLELLKTVGLDRINSFFRASEQVERGLMDTGGDKIVMSTMHGAKGKEWPYVVLFADDNVAFPSFDGITTMLNKGIEMNDISNSLDENRRLHYVAMTRAKENLTVFTDKKNPSVFLLEAFGLFNPGKHKSNGMIISMAESGNLADVLVERGEKFLFSKDYAYHLEVDISKVMKEEEEDKTEMPEEVIEFSLGMDDEEEMMEY